MHCNVGFLLWGVIATIVGVRAFTSGIAAWKTSGSKLPNKSTVIGLIFVVVGLGTTTQQIVCRSYTLFPKVLDLGWTWWPGIWPPMVFGMAIGVLNARSMRLIPGAVNVLFTTLLGVAAGQGAGFHTGVYAERWFAVAAFSGISIAIVNVLASRFAGFKRADRLPQDTQS